MRRREFKNQAALHIMKLLTWAQPPARLRDFGKYINTMIRISFAGNRQSNGICYWMPSFTSFREALNTHLFSNQEDIFQYRLKSFGLSNLRSLMDVNLYEVLALTRWALLAQLWHGVATITT
jgi:hypothetical protein